jgi:hypothetical protein
LNEIEADIKKAFQKPRITIGLVMIMMFSLIFGESFDYTSKFTYRFQVPGFTSTFAQSPKGCKS